MPTSSLPFSDATSSTYGKHIDSANEVCNEKLISQRQCQSLHNFLQPVSVVVVPDRFRRNGSHSSLFWLVSGCRRFYCITVFNKSHLKLKLFFVLLASLIMLQYMWYNKSALQDDIRGRQSSLPIANTVPAYKYYMLKLFDRWIDAENLKIWTATDQKFLSTSISEALTLNSTVCCPSNVTKTDSSLPLCPVMPPVLVGPIKVWFDYPSWSELEKIYSNLEPGGHGKPANCVSRNRVAVIVPYRDRDKQLRAFMHNLHSLLSKQQLDYAIFVVEQISNQTFNRAKLLNVGFVEARKMYNWQCAVFHDVDLFPEDDRNLYTCPEHPRHMSVAIDKFNYRLPYSTIFGGISAMTVEQFVKVTGFSNDYWGWGGEDDDMATRVKINGYEISRYPNGIARYKMVKHTQEKDNPVNPCRISLMYKVRQRWRKDGLTSLNYQVVNITLEPLFTRITVDLLETESQMRLANEHICE